MVEGTDVPDIKDWNQVACRCFNEDITPQWPHRNIVMHNELNLKFKVLHYILTYNIAPSSHMTEIRHLRMQLLYAIAMGHDLNFSERIFYQIMALAHTKGNKWQIYFSSLISALCKKARVPLSSSEADKTKPITIGLYTIRQSQTQIAQYRHAARLVDEADGDEVEGDEAKEMIELEV